MKGTTYTRTKSRKGRAEADQIVGFARDAIRMSPMMGQCKATVGPAGNHATPRNAIVCYSRGSSCS